MPTYENANQALPDLLRKVLVEGEVVASRNGRTKELTMQSFTLLDPTPAEITVPGRKVSLPAQIAETMWLFAGRNDIGWLSHYLPRAADFSDDGQHWRGGYGPRLRAWQSEDDVQVDQLAHVVQLLKEDPTTRRAVLQVYNPSIDTAPGKDIPCNNWVHLLPRSGELHAHVAIRSNDLFWGWSGINSFEWTSLLTVVAGLTGLQRGSITFSISSLHLYEHHWDRARQIVANMDGALPLGYTKANPAFTFVGGLGHFDDVVHAWFEVEAMIREGSSDVDLRIARFPEPMLRSWLQVLHAWNTDSLHHAGDLRGTSLYEALTNSPKRKVPATEPVAAPDEDGIRAGFTEFAAQLHADKHQAYGNSWKKRGEMLGIMANLARKVDRLGVAGGGDSSADTAIDLLMYLLKYKTWLRTNVHNATHDDTEGTAHVMAVNAMLEHLQQYGNDLRILDNETLIAEVNAKFDRLEHWVEEKRADRGQVVEQLIQLAYPLAVRLWREEDVAAQAKAAWHAGNQTRQWAGVRDA